MSRTPAATDRLAELGIDEGLLAAYGSFLDTLEAPPGVPAAVVELCRARIAAIHGLPQPEPQHAGAEALAAARDGNVVGLSEAEQAAIALAERAPFEHHAMTAAEVARAAAHFGAEGVVGLLTAITMADANCRLALTLPPARQVENLTGDA